MKKGKGKGLKKVIITSIVLILLIVGLGFLCVPLFKDLKFGLDLQVIALGYPDETPDVKPRDTSKIRFIEPLN